MLFARIFGDKHGKKLMDTATKTRIDAVKTASKRVVQKTTEVTGDLIGNKVADKITSLGKTKGKEKEDKRQEIYILLEEDSKLLMTWDCFRHYIKWNTKKIINLLGTTPNEMPRFISDKWVELHDQSGSSNDRYKPSK